MIKITMKNESTKNPHDICMWNDNSQCKECSIKGKVQCHKDSNYTLWFMLGFFPGFISNLLGMVFGYFFGTLNLFALTLGLIIYFSYWAFFFIIWEPKILCSHCPYWAEGNAKVIHCYANEGIPKIVPYNPRPLSKSERIQFIIAIIIFVSIPLPILALGGQFIYLIISIIGIALWLIILNRKICIACVNFSCPLNRVPKNIVDDFLKRNSVMREAWEKSGYKIDN